MDLLACYWGSVRELLLSFTVFIYLQLKVLILKRCVINNILQYTLDNIFFCV